MDWRWPARSIRALRSDDTQGSLKNSKRHARLPGAWKFFASCRFSVSISFKLPSEVTRRQGMGILRHPKLFCKISYCYAKSTEHSIF
ncbi:hypothetical protein EMPG_16236 [Blastomyces silverae]|uniref:Uncharacterized protein n=1 Tax=Blastomyces silverae TaxID=2060906 RepID=A0A0H1BAF2_9EURO|nr:hypothetical protein EMPG_16236 [Blastomyces silverae]